MSYYDYKARCEKQRGEQREAMRELLPLLRKELKDYVKAKRCELRKFPKYLTKDSDICVDKLRTAFELFISETY